MWLFWDKTWIDFKKWPNGRSWVLFSTVFTSLGISQLKDFLLFPKHPFRRRLVFFITITSIYAGFKEIFSVNSHLLKYIENNTWSHGDMEFIFECSHRYRTSERSERVRYRMWTLEDKFHISARPCIILYICAYLDVSK